MTTPLKLDTAKFRKVHTLMMQGTTPWERAAAKDKVHLLSAGAGLTVEEATALLDQPPQPLTWFDSLFNDPDLAAERQEREKRRASEREALLQILGSEDAIWADTENEAALSAAVDHLKDWLVITKPDGTVERTPAGLGGLPTGFGLEQVSEQLRGLIRGAVPFPKNLPAALAEYRDWDKLYLDRNLFGNYEHWWWSDVRIMLLEDVLDNQPVIGWDDLQARMEWWSVIVQRGMLDWQQRMESLRQRLLADHDILRTKFCAAAQPSGPGDERRTAAQRAEEVRRMIISDPTASNRAVAKEVGVSPQTVGNWRTRLQCLARQVATPTMSHLSKSTKEPPDASS
jgi:hypothetical protein